MYEKKDERRIKREKIILLWTYSCSLLHFRAQRISSRFYNIILLKMYFSVHLVLICISSLRSYKLVTTEEGVRNGEKDTRSKRWCKRDELYYLCKLVYRSLRRNTVRDVFQKVKFAYTYSLNNFVVEKRQTLLKHLSYINRLDQK